jgi:hypothetical protein
MLNVLEYLGNEPFSCTPSRRTSDELLSGVSSPHGEGEGKTDGGANESGDYRV